MSLRREPPGGASPGLVLAGTGAWHIHIHASEPHHSTPNTQLSPPHTNLQPWGGCHTTPWIPCFWPRSERMSFGTASHGAPCHRGTAPMLHVAWGMANARQDNTIGQASCAFSYLKSGQRCIPLSEGAPSTSLTSALPLQYLPTVSIGLTSGTGTGGTTQNLPVR